MSMAPSQLGGFVRSDPGQPHANLQYHVQPLSLRAYDQPIDNFPAFTASICNLNPESRGTVRIRSESERPVFVGIGPAAAVDRYLRDVARDEIHDLDNSGDPELQGRPGGAPSSPPGSQRFWTASETGAGEQTVDWDPEDGTWRVVLMNSDGSRGVSSDMSIGAELDSVLWIGLGLLGLGVLFAAGTALAITGAVRRR